MNVPLPARFRFHAHISIKNSLCCFVFFDLIFFPAKNIIAQIDASIGYTATELAEALAGGGVEVSDATISCLNTGKGMFNCIDCNVGIESGIVLTSGKAVNIEGPNNVGSMGYAAFLAGDSDLENLPGVSSTTQDACILEFDLVPISDTIRFEYVFGSEEYLEFVGSAFNDVFAFFISGPGITGEKNIALIPGTAYPVEINSVNSTSPYSAYYNYNGTGINAPYATDNYYIQYDGFTDVLEAVSEVIPCETYHLKLAIADAGDANYDSGVFLKANSLMANLSFEVDGMPAASGDTVYVAMGSYTDLEAIAPDGYTFTWSPPTGLSDTTGSSVTATVTSTITYTVTATNCTTFTGTITLIPDVTILPIQLIQFDASCSGNTAVLNWSTLSEINSNKFIVEKSFDAEHFEIIGEISAAGFSNALLQYTFIDMNPHNFSSYYRLKCLDNSGIWDYSQTVITDCKLSSSEFEINSAAIQHNQLSLELMIPANGEYIVQLFDEEGCKLISDNPTLKTGLQFVYLPLPFDLPSQMYIAKLTQKSTGKEMAKKTMKVE